MSEGVKSTNPLICVSAKNFSAGLAKFFPCFGHITHDLFQIGRSGNFVIDYCVDIILGIIDHGFNLAIGNNVNLPLLVADLSLANTDRFHAPLSLGNLDNVANQKIDFRRG